MPWHAQKGHLFCSEPAPVAATAVPSNSKNLWDMKISLVQFEDMKACVWLIKSTVDTHTAVQDGFMCKCLIFLQGISEALCYHPNGHRPMLWIILELLTESCIGVHMWQFWPCCSQWWSSLQFLWHGTELFHLSKGVWELTSNSDNWTILTGQTVQERTEKLQEEKRVWYKVVGNYGAASLKDIVIQDVQEEFRFKCKNLILTFALIMWHFQIS